MKSGRKVENTSSIQGEDLLFFLEITMILGEKSKRQDQSSFSFFREHQFSKILASGPIHHCIHRWGLAPLQNYECGASEQISNHVLIAYPIHRAPHGARCLTVLDKEIRC